MATSFGSYHAGDHITLAQGIIGVIVAKCALTLENKKHFLNGVMQMIGKGSLARRDDGHIKAELPGAKRARQGPQFGFKFSAIAPIHIIELVNIHNGSLGHIHILHKIQVFVIAPNQTGAKV